ncbi:MAG: MFS transporter [Promethearchaeota archaeon]
MSSKDFLPFEPRMKPTKADEINVKRTIFFSFSFMTVLLAWSFFNFKVPLLLNDVLGANPYKDLIKGFVMALDNIIAMLLQPVFGDLSDRTTSRFGRRMPFIAIGTISSAFFFILIPWMQVLAGLILIVFLFDLAMSIYRSASIAILPDYTSEQMYSKASAIQQFIANMGGLIGFIIPIIIGFIPNITVQWIDALGFLIIALVMLVLLALQLIYIKETPTGDKFIGFVNKKLEIDKTTFKVLELEEEMAGSTENAKGRLKSYRDAGKIIKGHRDFAYFLATVVFMYLAFASVESFFSSFAIEYLGLFQTAFQQTGDLAEAKKIAESQASTLFLAYSGPMIASAYFVGLLGQNKRIGRKNAIKIYLGWMIVMLLVMSFIVVPNIYHDYQPFLIIIMLMLISIPWMGFIVNSFAFLWELAPEGKQGMYTGIYYTFNQAAYTTAPILFGAILSMLISMGDYRYIIMFPFISFCIIVAFVFFIRIKGKTASTS